MPGIAIVIALTICAGAVPPQISIVTLPADTTGMNPAGTRIFIIIAQASTHAVSAR